MRHGKLSENIMMYRKERGLTQKELASELNYSDKVISKWERNASSPDLDALVALADFFGVTIDHLIGRQDRPDGNTAIGEPVELELTHVRKPSPLIMWSILPLGALWLWTISMGPGWFALASAIFGLILSVYSILTAYHTWRVVHDGHEIIIENRPTRARLIVDGVLQDRDDAIFRSGIRLTGKLDGNMVVVWLNSLWKLECDVVLIPDDRSLS
jgi:transcriptional regulator with XRE-family HTH domain